MDLPSIFWYNLTLWSLMLMVTPISASGPDFNQELGVHKEETMIENLSKEQIEGIFNALPFQIVFIDEDDRIQYWNEFRGRLLEANADNLGKDVRTCHKKKSLPRLEQILSDFKSGKKDEAEFWIPMEHVDVKALNRLFAIRDESGNYLGTLEYLLNFTYLDRIAEEKKDAYRARS